MKNRIASIALTVVMILGCMIKDTNFNMNTVCADPYNIEVRVETKEISIEEIPEDRRVPVEVYVSNVPNEDFYILNLAFKIDSKLEKWINYCNEDDFQDSISIRSSIENNNYIFFYANTVTHHNKKIENGKLFKIMVFIPPEVQEGFYYEIIPVDCCNTEDNNDTSSFSFESNRDDLFGSSNFSFIGGGIKIRSSQPEQPISNDPVPTSDNENSISQNEIPNSQSQINNDTNDEITTVTSSETSCFTVSTASSTKSTAALSSTTFKESTESETNVIINTESLNSSEVTKEKSSYSNIIRLFLILLILLIMIVAFIIIIKRRKKDSNDNQH